MTLPLPMRLRRAFGLFGLLAVTSVAVVFPAGAGSPAEPPAAGAPADEAYVRLRDSHLLVLRVAVGGQSPEARARQATHALAAVLESSGPKPVHIEEAADRATLFVAAAPILQLAPEDAAAAGDANLHVYAAAAQATFEHALAQEARRQSLQNLVLRISLAVFFGLIAFLLIRQLGDLEGAVERWLEARPRGPPVVRLGNVELASESAVRGGLRVVLRFGKRALQLVLAYVWFYTVLHLFEATRPTGDRITGMLVEPLGRLAARVAGAVPQLLALSVLGLLLFLILRGIQLFFGSVSRGETHLSWVPADLARPTSMLLQGALLVFAVVFAGPVISDGAGPFQGLAQALLIGLALACAPLFAAVVAGLPVVYGRGLRVGEVAEVGGKVGTVKEVDLLSVVLEDAEGRPVRVPHLVSLVQPTRVLGPALLNLLDVTVASDEDQARVQSLLAEAAGSHASGGRVELRALDAAGAGYRVTSGYPDVGQRVAQALKDAGVRLATLGEAGATR